MNVYTGILVYVMIWWVVLFAVLPWGIRRSEAPQPGHAVEAPSNPRIALRFAVTTVIATVIATKAITRAARRAVEQQRLNR